MAVNEKIRVRLRSYDHTLIDAAAEKIVNVAKTNGCQVSGPIPLPTRPECLRTSTWLDSTVTSRSPFSI